MFRSPPPAATSRSQSATVSDTRVPKFENMLLTYTGVKYYYVHYSAVYLVVLHYRMIAEARSGKCCGGNYRETEKPEGVFSYGVCEGVLHVAPRAPSTQHGKTICIISTLSARLWASHCCNSVCMLSECVYGDPKSPAQRQQQKHTHQPKTEKTDSLTDSTTRCACSRTERRHTKSTATRRIVGRPGSVYQPDEFRHGSAQRRGRTGAGTRRWCRTTSRYNVSVFVVLKCLCAPVICRLHL